jgi:DNA end-binding protein Ku
MRAMWKGAVAFGLVNVPIKLYAATEDHDVRFHQVHAADGGRVKMVRTCTVDGKPIEYKELAKAYESDSGQVVIMEDADFEGLPVPGMREIEVVEFVPSDQVDPVLFDRSYYLEPEPRALKPYVLLREALSATDRTALVRVVLRQKTQLGALRVRGDVLVLQTMLWPDEVRAADFDVLDAEVDIRPQELSMASSLIDSLSTDFDPGEFRDEYREALLAVIDRKLAGGQGITAPVAVEAGDGGDGIVLDLMAALRESVQRNQSAKPAAASEPASGTTASGAKASGARASGAESKAATATAKAATAAASKGAKPGAAPSATARKTVSKAPAKKAAGRAGATTSTAAPKKAAKTTESTAKTARRRTA